MQIAVVAFLVGLLVVLVVAWRAERAAFAIELVVELLSWILFW